MARIADSAVVLRRLDYSETSQIVVLFTRRHGKVRAIAKGIKRGTKKRFATGIDLFDIGQVDLRTRQDRPENLANVTEWTQVQALSGLRERLHRLHAAQYAVEVTGHLTADGDPHAELYDALVSTLAELSEAEESLGPIVGYQRRLLEVVGSAPRFDGCVKCSRAGDLTHFSSFEGGMICGRCAPSQVEKRQVSAPTLQALRAHPNIPRAADFSPRGRSDSGVSGETPRAKIHSASFVGSFRLFNYHISHLMAREPLLAAKLLPVRPRRPAV